MPLRRAAPIFFTPRILRTTCCRSAQHFRSPTKSKRARLRRTFAFVQAPALAPSATTDTAHALYSRPRHSLPPPLWPRTDRCKAHGYAWRTHEHVTTFKRAHFGLNSATAKARTLRLSVLRGSTQRAFFVPRAVLPPLQNLVRSMVSHVVRGNAFRGRRPAMSVLRNAMEIPRWDAILPRTQDATVLATRMRRALPRQVFPR